MRILGRLKGGAERLFRFKVGQDQTWPERTVKEQAILAELRRMPHFDCLMDQLDVEMAHIIQEFLDAETPEDAVAAWHEGRAFSRMSRRIEGVTTARDRGEAAEEAAKRQVDLMKADADRRRHMRRMLDRRQPMGQSA